MSNTGHWSIVGSTAIQSLKWFFRIQWNPAIGESSLFYGDKMSCDCEGALYTAWLNTLSCTTGRFGCNRLKTNPNSKERHKTVAILLPSSEYCRFVVILVTVTIAGAKQLVSRIRKTILHCFQVFLLGFWKYYRLLDLRFQNFVGFRFCSQPDNGDVVRDIL